MSFLIPSSLFLSFLLNLTDSLVYCYIFRRQRTFNVDRGVPPIIIFNPDPNLDISSGDLSLQGYTTLLSVLEVRSLPLPSPSS